MPHVTYRTFFLPFLFFFNSTWANFVELFVLFFLIFLNPYFFFLFRGIYIWNLRAIAKKPIEQNVEVGLEYDA